MATLVARHGHALHVTIRDSRSAIFLCHACTTNILQTCLISNIKEKKSKSRRKREEEREETKLGRDANDNDDDNNDDDRRARETADRNASSQEGGNESDTNKIGRSPRRNTRARALPGRSRGRSSRAWEKASRFIDRERLQLAPRSLLPAVSSSSHRPRRRPPPLFH